VGPAVTGREASPLGRVLSATGVAILSALGFLGGDRLLPAVQIPWGKTVAGALVAGALFEAAMRAFFWYVQNDVARQLVYGSVTGIMLFL
jgi:uncharacterized BrkB/YihY/UPF0761 family membrane protein